MLAVQARSQPVADNYKARKQVLAHQSLVPYRHIKYFATAHAASLLGGEPRLTRQTSVN